MDDKVFYQQVADEISSGTIDRAAWTKAFAEADGNESVTKARYVKARVAELRAADKATRKAQRPRARKWMLARWPWVALILCAFGYSGLQRAIEAGAVGFMLSRTRAYSYPFTAEDGNSYSIESDRPLDAATLAAHQANINQQLIARNGGQPFTHAAWYQIWTVRMLYIFGAAVGLLLIPALLALIFRGRWRLGLAWAALLLAGFFSTYAVAIDHWGKAEAQTFNAWLTGVTVLAFLVWLIAVLPKQGTILDPSFDNVRNTWGNR